MAHGIAMLIAAVLVIGTVLYISVDIIRSAAKNKQRAACLAQCQAPKTDTRHMEREIDEKLEEMETLKGLSGIQSFTGQEVRAAIAAGAAPAMKMSDSQITRNFQEKVDQVIREVEQRKSNG